MKKIVIMGASSGIGLSLAEAFASRGVKIGVAARNVTKLVNLASKYPGMVEYEAIDVTSPQASSKLLKLVSRLGGMDIYIHVAGIGYENTTLDPELEVKIFETNTLGFVRCICTAYRYFRENGIKGHIAALTSVAGTNGIDRLSAYSASKAADQKWLIALEQLSNMSDAGITFTDIRPGWIKTPLLLPDTKYPMEMDLDYVTPLIIKAIAKKKRVAVIDWRWNIIVGLWRMIPNCLYTHMDMKISMPDSPLPDGSKQMRKAIQTEDKDQEIRDTNPK